MKVNRKLKLIFVGLALVALVLTIFLYNVMKKSVEPETEVSVPVFKHDLMQDSEITKEDIKYITIKTSAVPKVALTNADDIKGKRLLAQAYEGEYFFAEKLSERGVTRVNIDDMYVIGCDVENISDSLGIQLIVGQKYLIYSKIPGLVPLKIAEGTIVALVNTSGKETTGADGSATKTINIAVKTEQEMKDVMTAEQNRAIEIIKPPQK